MTDYILTVVSRKYLASALSLFESVRRWMPDAGLILGLIDSDIPDHLKQACFRGVTILTPAEVFGEDLGRLSSKYDMFRLAMVAKSAAMQASLRRIPNIGKLLYIDSDCYVTASFIDVLHSGGIYLTPHFTQEMGRMSLVRAKSFLRAGIYNAGFVGIQNSAVGREFVEWWYACVSAECCSDLLHPSYVDQGYLDLVPVLFPDVVVLGGGVNVGYWQLGLSNLSSHGGGYFLSDLVKLKLLHLSGFELCNALELSRFPNAILRTPALSELLAEYAAVLSANVARVEAAMPCEYAGTRGCGPRASWRMQLARALAFGAGKIGWWLVYFSRRFS